MSLRHYIYNHRPLDKESTLDVLKHLYRLWGFDINLESVDQNDNVHASFHISEDVQQQDFFLDIDTDIL